MREYRVIWQIDVDAESPREAAQRAATTLRNVDVDDECGATVFDVYERRAGRVERTGMRIDLSNETENRAIRFRVDTMPQPLALASDSLDITTALTASLVDELHDLESAETIWRRVGELETQQVQPAAAASPLVASASAAERATPIDPAPVAPEPVLAEPKTLPDVPLAAAPDVPVIVITEVLGHGRRRRGAARVVDGDVPPNSQLGFRWLLTSQLLGASK